VPYGVLVWAGVGFSQSVPGGAAASAPVPAAIVNAKTIFIANAGADGGLFPHPFSGEPSRGYDEFYAAIKGLGGYEVVSDPSQADLVLEIRLRAPYGPSNADKTKGAADPLPAFRLVVFDRKSHYVLWALTESVDTAYKQQTHDRNFDEAVASLVSDFQALTRRQMAPAH
jgi:hypothetical protein